MSFLSRVGLSIIWTVFQ